jgi:hypothetical protein
LPLLPKLFCMHPITGYYFFSHANGKKYVVYSTLYKSGRYASMHECTDLTDEQARGKFVIEHSNEVDLVMRQKQVNEQQNKIVLQ